MYLSTQPHNRAVLPLNQMARHLRVTQQWLREQAEAGSVPCLPAGGKRYLFNREAVEAALAKQAAEGGN